MEFRWRTNDGPLLCYFDPLFPHQLKRHEIYIKKTLSESKLSGSASTKRERERERARERAYGALETFSHNFDFYVVQTAERVHVIVM